MKFIKEKRRGGGKGEERKGRGKKEEEKKELPDC